MPKTWFVTGPMRRRHRPDSQLIEHPKHPQIGVDRVPSFGDLRHRGFRAFTIPLVIDPLGHSCEVRIFKVSSGIDNQLN